MPENFTDELMDMIINDESPSQISDKMKDLLFAKSAEKVETARPVVANSLFGDQEVEDGFVLACQAHPASSKVIVDFD